jgi:signal transduction histidine kinase
MPLRHLVHESDTARLDKGLNIIVGASALASEKVVSWIRILLCGSEVIRSEVERTVACSTSSRGEIAAMLSPLVFAIFFSLYVLFIYRRPIAKRWLLLCSVSIDASIAFAALVPNILYPGPDFSGILGVPDTAVILIITIAAGFRLSVGAAMTGGVLNAVSLISLVLIDRMVNGPRYFVSAAPLSFYYILLGVAMILALIIAQRTRSLVWKAAEESLHALKAQVELAHAEKLVTIGTMAASVGHEINNPNNALLISLETQKKIWNELQPVLDAYAQDRGDFEVGGYQYSELRDEMPQSIGRAIGNSERIRKIVQDLRAFARKDEGSYDETIDLNDVVDNALQLTGALVKKAGVLKLDLAAGLPSVKGNGQRLEQVVINLLQNAAQSLESREKSITVSTAFHQESKEVVLTVADEGRGMDEQAVKRAFEPFFTTKGASEGTGLGLSICKRIITAHKGRISISSQPGVGTKVTVALPQA